jgi:hypothetical protein
LCESIKKLLDAVANINNAILTVAIVNIAALNELIKTKSNFVNKIDSLTIITSTDIKCDFINSLIGLNTIKIIGDFVSFPKLINWCDLFLSNLQNLDIHNMTIVFGFADAKYDTIQVLSNCKIPIITLHNCQIDRPSILFNLSCNVKILKLTNNVYDELFDENILAKPFDKLAIDNNFCLPNKIYFDCPDISIYFGTDTNYDIIQHLLDSTDIKFLSICTMLQHVTETQLLSEIELWNNKDIVRDNICFEIDCEIFDSKKIKYKMFDKLFTVTSNIKTKNLYIKSNNYTHPADILEIFLFHYCDNEYLETLYFCCFDNRDIIKCTFDIR